MGWRVGYIAYPNFDGSDYLGLQLVKVQDTVPIHSAHMSQKVALGALAAGKPWVTSQMASLEQNRWEERLMQCYLQLSMECTRIKVACNLRRAKCQIVNKE